MFVVYGLVLWSVKSFEFVCHYFVFSICLQLLRKHAWNLVIKKPMAFFLLIKWIFHVLQFAFVVLLSPLLMYFISFTLSACRFFFLSFWHISILFSWVTKTIVGLRFNPEWRLVRTTSSYCPLFPSPEVKSNGKSRPQDQVMRCHLSSIIFPYL